MKKEYIIYIAVAVVVVIGVAAYILLTSSGCSACGKQVGSSYINRFQQIANNNILANNVGSGITISGPGSNPPKVVNASLLTFNGKPEILYVGGEFCPYCAITRWGLIVALMRFGNFTNLTYMESDPTDVYPNTPTFSFVNSSYRSNLVHFDGIEVYDRMQHNITNSNFTPTEQYIYGRFSTGGIPFVDFANGSIQSGAVVSPAVLHGLDWNQILTNMSNQNTVISQALIGQANLFTAYICKSSPSLNASAPACQQKYVKEIIG